MMENLEEVYSADEEYKVDNIRELLSQINFRSFVLNQKGSALLLGEMRPYVEKKFETKALNLIKNHKI